VTRRPQPQRLLEPGCGRTNTAWLPPVADVQCRYVGERVGTKLRWGLAVDAEELETLTAFGEACEATVVTYTAAP
jgi:hypothetical protein